MRQQREHVNARITMVNMGTHYVWFVVAPDLAVRATVVKAWIAA